MVERAGLAGTEGRMGKEICGGCGEEGREEGSVGRWAETTWEMGLDRQGRIEDGREEALEEGEEDEEEEVAGGKEKVNSSPLDRSWKLGPC